MQAMAKFWNLQVCNLFAALALVLSSLIGSAHDCARKLSDVDLLIRSGELTKGVPGTFSFVFVNNADHEVRIPPVSPCVGRYSGTVKLRVDFSPITTNNRKGRKLWKWRIEPAGDSRTVLEKTDARRVAYGQLQKD